MKIEYDENNLGFLLTIFRVILLEYHEIKKFKWSMQDIWVN